MIYASFVTLAYNRSPKTGPAEKPVSGSNRIRSVDLSLTSASSIKSSRSINSLGPAPVSCSLATTTPSTRSVKIPHDRALRPDRPLARSACPGALSWCTQRSRRSVRRVQRDLDKPLDTRFLIPVNVRAQHPRRRGGPRPWSAHHLTQSRLLSPQFDLFLLPLHGREAAKIYSGIVVCLKRERPQREVVRMHQTLCAKHSGLGSRYDTSCKIVGSGNIIADRIPARGRPSALSQGPNRRQNAGQQQGNCPQTSCVGSILSFTAARDERLLPRATLNAPANNHRPHEPLPNGRLC